MFEILKYLGNFHPVILHLPIGALYFTVFLVFFEKVMKQNFFTTIRIGLLFSFVFALLSCFLGYFLSLGSDYGENILNIHMWLGISTTLFIGILLFLQKNKAYKKFFKPSFLATIILLTFTGHYGGSMTHGEDFLAFPEKKIEINADFNERINMYSDVVRPILDNKCIKCHNQNKSNGKLRLTDQEQMLFGGKSGPILIPSNSNESLLYSYLELPIDHKLHMPPKGNQQLKDHEVELIKYWIDSGASFSEYEVPNQEDEELIYNLSSFFPPAPTEIELPKQRDLEKLKDLNFRVERYSVDNNYLDVKFLGDKVQQKHLNGLLNISKQLIKLDMSNSQLDDQFMSIFSKFKSLEYLKINGNPLSDTGLKKINDNLKSLNLNNTNVSYVGVDEFLKNSTLKNLYLWNTNIKTAEQNQLLQDHNVDINFGSKSFGANMPLSAPLIVSKQTLFKDSIFVEIFNAIGKPDYRYTLDGAEPDSLSLLYDSPIKIDKSTTLKIKAFKKGWKESETTYRNYYATAGNIEDYKLTTSPHPTYKNLSKLSDGILGDTDFRSGEWNGFQKNDDSESTIPPSSGDMVLEINIPKGLKTNSIGIHALSYMNDYITFPERLELYDISSNKNRLIYFKNIDKEDAGQIPKTVVYELPISESNIDKVKLVVKSNKKLPKGHVAEGQYAWFFVSEIFFML